MRGNIDIDVADDNSLIIKIYPLKGECKTVTCAPKDYDGLADIVREQVVLFQAQPVVDITKD